MSKEITPSKDDNSMLEKIKVGSIVKVASSILKEESKPGRTETATVLFVHPQYKLVTVKSESGCIKTFTSAEILEF